MFLIVGQVLASYFKIIVVLIFSYFVKVFVVEAWNALVSCVGKELWWFQALVCWEMEVRFVDWLWKCAASPSARCIWYCWIWVQPLFVFWKQVLFQFLPALLGEPRVRFAWFAWARPWDRTEERRSRRLVCLIIFLSRFLSFLPASRQDAQLGCTYRSPNWLRTILKESFLFILNYFFILLFLVAFNCLYLLI